MLLLKRFLGLIIGLVAVALIFVIWEETAKVTGDASAAGSTGAAVALSGARVTLYEVTPEQQQHLTASLASLQQQNQQEKEANGRVFSIDSADNQTRSTLAGYNNLSDTKFCFALEKAVDEVRKIVVRKQNTDSQGHFAFRALPGHYVLEILSQANGQYTLYIETVEPKWHSDFKLSEPTCRYSFTN